MTNNVWRNFAAEWRDFLASATPDRIEGFLASLAPGEASRLVRAWPLWARSSQLPPPGDWRVWLLMAGRGFGKTRAGAEGVRGLAGSGAARSVALVGDTAEDVRQVMIEGPSGLLAVSPAASRPIWHRSLRRPDWPSGMAAPRRQALISMAFNLGGPRLAVFCRMRAAIAAGDWDEAAAEALDSRWAAQTGSRADEIAALLRSG